MKTRNHNLRTKKSAKCTAHPSLEAPPKKFVILLLTLKILCDIFVSYSDKYITQEKEDVS